MDIAHLKDIGNRQFEFQSINDHLTGCSDLAMTFASKFENADWAKIIGLWHDIGKYSSAFQEYIRVNSGYEEDDQKRPKTDHTSAGAILAKEKYPQCWPPIAYCIAGHHAGLHNWNSEIGISGDLQERLQKNDFLERIKGKVPQDLLGTTIQSVPTGKAVLPEHWHIWIRMLFSCLVDADYLDTERFMNPSSFELRGKYLPLAELKSLFDRHMQTMQNEAADTEINRIRTSILTQCVNAATREPGFFSITVPTGGGKTLSSMAWALNHAVNFGKERIVVVIPYTSIITQTVQVYRKIFGESNVVEHHSNIDEDVNSIESKLATENWDAPIVVTTNVQLFESLYSNKSSRCRKLHNLVNSIIILDEAQMLPPEFLKPILESLKALVGNYHVSVLLSTATQPALTGKIGSSDKLFVGLAGNPVRELVVDCHQLVTDLKRVELQMPETTSTSWDKLADELQLYEQVLCIVNTRRECRELFDLMPEGTIHLSRMMCTAHIMAVIEEIKQRLKDGMPLRVISTQLIEAGVDVDFPVVYRAFAGLDSIAQSAGRCNREGMLNKVGRLGLTKVFFSPNGTPPGLMRKGADALKELLALQEADYFAPDAFKKYFTIFYSKVNDFDKPKTESLLVKEACEMRFQFATAARNFQLIDDKGSVSIMVEYGEGTDLIALFKRKGPEPWLMRKLQRYTVTVKEYDFKQIQKSGLVEQIHGCWVQTYAPLYSAKAGLMREGQWLEEIHII